MGIKEEILKKEGLDDWKIIYGNSGGGLTLLNEKEILLDERYRNTLGMFLHEVAHAIKGKGHDAIWADEFTRLVEKYGLKT